MAERVRAAVADQPFVLDDGGIIEETCSIGFACFPPTPAWARAVDWLATGELNNVQSLVGADATPPAAPGA